jgi:hypothetical protein
MITRHLFFCRSSSLQLQAYSDATWASDPMDCCLLSAYCVFLGGSLIARDLVKHELTKHIGVDAFYTRASLQDQVIVLHYVPSELQLADFFTKAQTREQHSFFLSKVSVVDPP